jgi:hypothetical protein
MWRNIEEVGARAGQSNETPSPDLEIGIQRLKKNTAIWSPGNRGRGAGEAKFTRQSGGLRAAMSKKFGAGSRGRHIYT